MRNLQDDALNARENAILYARYAKRGFSTANSLREPCGRSEEDPEDTLAAKPPCRIICAAERGRGTVCGVRRHFRPLHGAGSCKQRVSAGIAAFLGGQCRAKRNLDCVREQRDAGGLPVHHAIDINGVKNA